jgi:hypothetical protein
MKTHILAGCTAMRNVLDPPAPGRVERLHRRYWTDPRMPEHYEVVWELVVAELMR